MVGHDGVQSTMKGWMHNPLALRTLCTLAPEQWGLRPEREVSSLLLGAHTVPRADESKGTQMSREMSEAPERGVFGHSNPTGFLF